MKRILSVSMNIFFILLGFAYAQPKGLEELQSGKINKQSNQQTEISKKDTHNESEMLIREFEGSPDSSISNLKNIFQSEVLTFPNYFFQGALNLAIDDPNPIHDDHVELNVDRDLLWNYIKFDSTNFSTTANSSSTVVCILINVENKCLACESYRNSIMNGFIEAFKNRGFAIKLSQPLASPLIAQSTSRGEKNFEEMVARISSDRIEADTKNACDGAFYLEIFKEYKEKDQRLNLFGFLELKTLSGKKVRSKSETQAYLLDLNPKNKVGYQSQQQFARKVVAHQVVQLFGKKNVDTSSSKTTSLISSKNPGLGVESYLEIENISSFAKIQNFKMAYNDIFPQFPLEERWLRPGVFRFAIKNLKGETGEGQVSVAQIVTKLKGNSTLGKWNVKFEVVQLKPSSVDEGELVVISLR